MMRFLVALSCLALFFGGCRGEMNRSKHSTNDSNSREIADAKVVGLSEISFVDKSIPRSDLKIYVDLLNKERNNIAAPAIFRFELYNYQPYIGDRRGSRLFLWKDIDLRDPQIAGEYWRSIFKSYEFNLSLPVALSRKKYLFVATIMTSENKRITTSYVIGYQNAR